jgi:hypothetical protein
MKDIGSILKDTDWTSSWYTCETIYKQATFRVPPEAQIQTTFSRVSSFTKCRYRNSLTTLFEIQCWPSFITSKGPAIWRATGHAWAEKSKNRPTVKTWSVDFCFRVVLNVDCI